MAIPVARVHLAMAHAALPALLPTPPKWKTMMMPLLPTPPCVLILPMAMSSPAKPSRADAVERWDAHKTVKPAASPASSSGSSKRTPNGKSSSSPASSSCERWDSNKESAASSSSSGRSASRASSVERWDAHKKARPAPAQKQQADDGIVDDGQSSTGSNDMEIFYAGPGYIASPEPSTLPMPTSLMVRVSA